MIACEGAPRDLGLDQGRACAAAIRARVARAGGRGDWLGRWRPFAPGALAHACASARDLRRHFPHQDECTIGLARGAGVPELALHHLLAHELRGEGEGAAVRAGFDGEGRIVFAPADAGILRRVEPDAGFGSAEWTLPWLPGAFAGVNRAGLAGAVTSFAFAGVATCAAPAFLLLQNCLAQFETVANAVEWCERRPAGGRAMLLFADATGGRAAIGIEGGKRFRSEPPDPSEAEGAALVIEACGATLRAGAHTVAAGT